MRQKFGMRIRIAMVSLATAVSIFGCKQLQVEQPKDCININKGIAIVCPEPITVLKNEKICITSEGKLKIVESGKVFEPDKGISGVATKVIADIRDKRVVIELSIPAGDSATIWAENYPQVGYDSTSR